MKLLQISLFLMLIYCKPVYAEDISCDIELYINQLDESRTALKYYMNSAHRCIHISRSYLEPSLLRSLDNARRRGVEIIVNGSNVIVVDRHIVMFSVKNSFYIIDSMCLADEYLREN